MVKVTLPDGTLLAESNSTVVVEGNHYFPPSDVQEALLTKSSTSTVCHWKGTASYYDAVLDGKTVVNDVAWFHENPKKEAENIKGYVAFYKNKVNIEA